MTAARCASGPGVMAATIPDAPLRVAIVGGGSFGSVMARVVASAAAAAPARFEPAVAWWVRREEQAAEICSQRTNVAYLGPDCILPDNLHATSDLAQALRAAACTMAILLVLTIDLVQAVRQLIPVILTMTSRRRFAERMWSCSACR